VTPAESYSAAATEQDQLEAIAALQQRAMRLEGEIREREKLEEALRAVATEHARLYRQAQDAIRKRDDFLMAITHDLRTPLTVILAQAQSVERRLSSEPVDLNRVRESLAGIKRRGLGLSMLIDELVDATRLEMGQDITLSSERVELRDLVRDVAEGMQHVTDAHRVEIKVADGELPSWCDPARLTRVIGNLLNNAVKYSPEGGDVEVCVDRCGSEAVISISDHGIGIPEADLPHVFDRFYRAHNAGRTSGTGIGLATAREIVELHGGSIAVSSEEGKGSTFVVRLPLAESADSGSALAS
jgi:signal transduction histidine kinase